MNKALIFLWLLFMQTNLFAQFNPDQSLDSSIHTILVHPEGRPRDLPIIGLNDPGVLTISFDDFNFSYQNYFYSIELVDDQWQPVPISPFEYTTGFAQNKINIFNVSSIAIQPYYHYQFNIPNQQCKPTKAGNYILKVFKDGNPSNVVFTRRFYVVNSLIGVYGSVQEPFDGAISRTHQKIQLSLDVKQLSYFQPDQIKVVVIQNHRLNDAKIITEPSFIRGNQIEFNSDRDFIFPGGNEARWLDLQSLRLRSDRVQQLDMQGGLTKVIVKTDFSKSQSPYFTFNDLNGAFIISNSESLQSEYQNDYANVLFTYKPPNGIPYVGHKLYLMGDLTQNKLNSGSEMQFNGLKGVYEKTMLLKQGYYSYQYILRDQEKPIPMDDFKETEGDHWETENSYTIFVYYTAPGARYPMIAGFSTINSRQNW
ncbi:MAG: hypothetical protein RIR47_1164 [Bacteroidota bacterium]|jgi:hypothetical protein